jgi:hypothetical protein
MNTLHKPKPAPAAKSWRNLTDKQVTIRLKSGVTVSGKVADVALNVVALTDARLLERDATDWLIPAGLVHVDATSISFAIEGGE